MNTDKPHHPSQKHCLLILAVLFCLTPIGCRSFETHPWTSPDNAERIYLHPPVEEQNRVYIHPDDLFRPHKEHMHAVVQRLSETACVLLTWDQFEMFTGVTDINRGNVNPYLLRAVSWNNKPWYTLVYFDKTTGVIYTEQITYNGEMYLPGDNRALPRPIVALLDREPVELKAYAVWGGDSAMRRFDLPQAWKED